MPNPGTWIIGLGIVVVLVVLAAWRIRVVKRLEAEIAQKAAAPAVASAPTPAPLAIPAPAAPKQGQIPAKGSLGQLELWDTDEPTAAMVMAIVADQMKAPLNELRFKSIRKVK